MAHRNNGARDIIGIGASAGGVAALREVFSHLPGDLPATIFAVLHRGSSLQAADVLVNVLGRKASLTVVEPVDGERFVRRRIYLAPPDRHMVVADGSIYLRSTPKQHYTRPALDPLFVSLAENFGRRVIGVVLTGCGRDGVDGLLAISAEGGVSLAQDPIEAQEPSMPLEAIRADDVKAVLPLAEIPPALEALVQGVEPPDLQTIGRTRRASV